jgi:hypothetical protein
MKSSSQNKVKGMISERDWLEQNQPFGMKATVKLTVISKSSNFGTKSVISFQRQTWNVTGSDDHLSISQRSAERTRRLNALKSCRLHLLVAVGFDDVVRASSKEHVAAAAVAAAASADKLPRGLRSFQAVE